MTLARDPDVKGAAVEAFPRNATTTEAVCARILERHRDHVSVRKPHLATANLARIIEAVLKLSSRQSFHEISLRDLARVTGLSMGGLYSYFDNKNTLLVMILTEVSETVEAVLRDAPAGLEADPAAHLRWLIETHIRLTEAMQPWFVFAFMEAKGFPPPRGPSPSRANSPRSGSSRMCWRVGSSEASSRSPMST
ncbi:TetR/AcrR family transcriptional regulator [Methylobacterium persicinum]